MAVELPAFVAENTKVLVHLEGKPLRNNAIVRYSRAERSCFRVGLEFERSLLDAKLPAIDAVLATSDVTVSRYLPEPLRTWAARAFVVRAKKAACLIAGHEFGWALGASPDILACRRCKTRLAIYGVS